VSSCRGEGDAERAAEEGTKLLKETLKSVSRPGFERVLLAQSLCSVNTHIDGNNFNRPLLLLRGL
jgi:hypothetical protein